MIFPKNSHYLLLMFISTLLTFSASAQKIDENTYRHKMQLIDGLSFYQMKDYDTLYKVSVLFSVHGRDYPEEYYGWIEKNNEKSLLFISTDGKELEIENKQITALNRLPINDATIEIFTNKLRESWRHMPSFGKNYLLNLWLYKKGKFDYSKQLLPPNDDFFSDNDIKNNFGIIYFDAMLSAFSNQRNYSKAIDFGNHLSGNIFTGYQYQKEAVELTAQLKNNTQDFKSFHIPDSLEWGVLKQKLSRKDQIIYLADRLRLLNCVQPGQPGGISYEMYQFSISCAQAGKLDIPYWEYNARYNVVNPYSELLQMKLSPPEIELLLPYLTTTTYIPTYTYFRDFSKERTLHKLGWVTHNLIFEVTNKLFFEQASFDSLSVDQKEKEVKKIKMWCDENASLSPEALTVKTLKTTDQWIEFRHALETARQAKYESILPIIVERFNDFKGGGWPTSQGVLAKTMFDLGSEKYIGTVKKWNKDTTDVWVNLWSSLFLLKFDKDSYEQAMNELASVIKQCDGTAYYPYAMDFLLSLKDKRALNLAEGILNKPQFTSFIYWDYYLNFIRKLLLSKSDYTFDFISKKLDSFTPEETNILKESNGDTNMLMQSDFYVLAIDKLRSDTPGYNSAADIKTRLAYIKALNIWFNTQYKLLKEGKPNELHLGAVPADAPVSFVDSPN